MMKTLKLIREEYDANFLDQVDYLPDELVLDEAKGSPIVKKLQSIPTPSQMPIVLVFRRITYRTYPDKQVVALYYSKLVDKYLSIPFGPTGNLNLSEAQVVEGKMLDAIKGAVKGGIKGAGAGAMLGTVGHAPGMATGAAIGGVVGAYKGAKKALQKEEELDEDWQSANRKDKTDGLSQAAVNAYRRENPGSKLKTAVTEKNPSGKRASRRKSFCSRMGGMKKRLTSAKTARDPDSRINKALRRWNCEEEFRSRLNTMREERIDEIAPLVSTAINWAAKKALGGALDLIKGGSGGNEKDIAGATTAKKSGELLRGKPGAKTSSAWKKGPQSNPIDVAREKTALAKQAGAIKENKIIDIRTMIKEGIESLELPINGRQVTLNTSMAKRILEVYDSVNTKNKKIVEGMLNEDLESFKKLLNFSIRN